MRKISNKFLTAKWYKLPEDPQVELKIRPFSFRGFNVVPTDMSKVSGENLWDMFNWCLVDWKGMDGEDDKPGKCDEKNKETVFTTDEEVLNFVLAKITELKESVVTEKDAKNLSTSQPGDTQKKES